MKEAVANIAEQSLDTINDSIVKRTSVSLAHAALQSPQRAMSGASAYDNGGYREPYSTSISGSLDPAAASPSTVYAMTGGASHSYSTGASISIPQQTSNAFENQSAYGTGDSTMTPNHAAALVAVPSNAAQPNNTYPYAPTHSQSSQQVYPGNGYTAQDWRQWTRTYMQPQGLGQPGEYLNTATTLMSLCRDGGSQDAGNNVHASLDGPSHMQWPDMAYPDPANSHGHLSRR